MPKAELDSLEVILRKCPRANRAALRSKVIDGTNDWLDLTRSDTLRLVEEHPDQAGSPALAKAAWNNILLKGKDWSDLLILACLVAGVQNVTAMTRFVSDYFLRWHTGRARQIAGGLPVDPDLKQRLQDEMIGESSLYVGRIPDRVRSLKLDHDRKEGSLPERLARRLMDNPLIGYCVFGYGVLSGLWLAVEKIAPTIGVAMKVFKK